MRRLVTLLVIAFALTVPAQASAITVGQVTAVVKKGFTQQISARLRLAGYKFLGDTVKCASIGSAHWTCYATYRAEKKGFHFKYGVYINVTKNGWKVVGNATLVKEW